MERGFLEECIECGMSLAEIGAAVGRDASTVGYWVAKHGLEANGRGKHEPRGGLAKDQLQPLVEAGLSYREIAVRLDRSPSTVRYWVRRHDLEAPRLFRWAEVEEASASGEPLLRECRRHGTTEYAIVGSAHRPRCKKCRSEAVARRRRRIKAQLVQEAGGRCLLCGYDRSVVALEFHHRDPTEKSFGIANRGVTRGIDEVRAEVRKCALLCANCHAEVEAGIASL